MNLAALLAFAKQAFSGSTPTGAQTPSASRSLLGLVVGAALLWLTGDLIFEGLTLNWVGAFSALLTAVSGGYAIGKFADRPPPGAPKP